MQIPKFHLIYPVVERLIGSSHDTISELNYSLIYELFNILKIETKVILASSLKLGEVKENGKVNYLICDRLGADLYLSGKSGRDYLDERLFSDAGIKVTYQDFQPVAYEQVTQSFVSDLSVLDILFMKEPAEAREVISNGYSI